MESGFKFEIDYEYICEVGCVPQVMSAQSATAGASAEDTSTTATSEVSSNVTGIGADQGISQGRSSN